jgi:hypothetical protein
VEPVELYGFLWHAVPDTKQAIEAKESIALPHWSDPPTPGVNPDGVILLTEQGDWHRRLGRSGYLLLSEQPVPPTVPGGWYCRDADLPDGWIGADDRSQVEVVTRGGPEDQSPVSGLRHYVRVTPVRP